ncbi:hypothetical protein ScPMuIL_013825 [Solemya velum]
MPNLETVRRTDADEFNLVTKRNERGVPISTPDCERKLPTARHVGSGKRNRNAKWLEWFLLWQSHSSIMGTTTFIVNIVSQFQRTCAKLSSRRSTLSDDNMQDVHLSDMTATLAKNSNIISNGDENKKHHDSPVQDMTVYLSGSTTSPVYKKTCITFAPRITKCAD